ncbi:MAG: RibD family protein [Candidatus Eisenbacteria bacterium]|uniref:RibD family protein n=1 Tax=Eiseniibacteriota bacterium TaxID=2212470 RepID=A0A849SSW8_UNCEI|nr:RibD family protein [Candidatus Eisenbacteria bacterium]
MRSLTDAIVIGSETARLDDPRLTVRGVRGARQPLRVVCDADASLPLTLRLFRPPLARGTVLVCTRRATLARVRAFERRGVRVWRVRAGFGGVCPSTLAERLAREGRHEVMLEGGAALAGSWIHAGYVDRLALFTAPTLLGRDGLEWAPPLGDAIRRGRIERQQRLGADTLTLVELER